MTADAILILGFIIGNVSGIIIGVLSDNIDKKKPAKFDPPV